MGDKDELFAVNVRDDFQEIFNLKRKTPTNAQKTVSFVPEKTETVYGHGLAFIAQTTVPIAWNYETANFELPEKSISKIVVQKISCVDEYVDIFVIQCFQNVINNYGIPMNIGCAKNFHNQDYRMQL